MTDSLPKCPSCSSQYTYELGELLVCPECAHEWSRHESDSPEDDASAPQEQAIKDAVGNTLTDGDNVVLVKDLKVKGAKNAIKKGTRVTGIRLIDPVNGHDIDAKVDGFGDMLLKSSVVRKA